MSEHTPSPKELAQAKLRARAARIARLRKRVIAASLATFVLAFGAIAYDGSMGTTSASTGTQTTASATSSGTSATTADSTTSDNASATDDSTSSSDDSSSSSSDDSSGSSPSAVTTRQS
jgi:hypothetical protein